jgi:hypothetical protein
MLGIDLKHNRLIGGIEMENTLLLCETARLHQRDVEREIAVRQIANQVKTAKPGRIKRFIMLNSSSNQGGTQAKAGEAFSGDHLILTTKT